MKRIVSAAILVALLGSTAWAQAVIVVPSGPDTYVVPSSDWRLLRRDRREADYPGASSVPGDYPTRAQRKLDTPSAGGGG
jgi:hypothetical protein